MSELVRYADRPDLHEIRFKTLSARTFPAFMHHNQTGTRYWGRLVPEHTRISSWGLLDDGELVAELHSLPLAWDGTAADLPPGWDDVFERFVRERPAARLPRRARDLGATRAAR